MEVEGESFLHLGLHGTACHGGVPLVVVQAALRPPWPSTLDSQPGPCAGMRNEEHFQHPLSEPWGGSRHAGCCWGAVEFTLWQRVRFIRAGGNGNIGYS